MVSILLTVLKIVGIMLLVIMGLILFLLLLVLFVPVRYCGRGSYLDRLPSMGLRATWLLHMISVRGEYQKAQAFHIYLKFLGITVYDNLKASGNKTRNKKVKSTKNKGKGHAGEIQAASSAGAAGPGENLRGGQQEDMRAEAEPAVREKSSAETGSTAGNGTSADAVEPACDSGQADAVEESDFPGGSSDGTVKKVGIVQKIKSFFIKFVNFFKNIKFTFNKVCDTIVKIKDNIRYYLKVLQLDDTKRAFAACQMQFVRILQRLSPRKYRVNLHLGFDDPAVMGEVLAVWGMLYPIHQGNVDIQPEFGQTVMEGDFFFQGRVSVSVFVKAICILFFDRDVKQLVKHLRRNDA